MRQLREIPIRRFGAIVPGQIGVGEARRRLLRAAGRIEPDPVHVTMLMDTGATCSWIRQAYMDQLRLVPRTWFGVERVHNIEQNRPGYEISLILGGVGSLLTKRFELLIGGAEFTDTQHDGLLGLGILSSLHLGWNGPSQQLRVSYD